VNEKAAAVAAPAAGSPRARRHHRGGVVLKRPLASTLSRAGMVVRKSIIVALALASAADEGECH